MTEVEAVLLGIAQDVVDGVIKDEWKDLEPEMTRALHGLATLLLRHQNATAEECEDAARASDELRDTVYNHLRRSRSQETYSWRRAYTDVCLLRTLATLKLLAHLAKDSKELEAQALRCVDCLDHAIIIAGAPGEGRLDLIITCIESVQAKLDSVRNVLASGQFHALSLTKDVALSSARLKVKELANPPSMSLFRSKLCHEPFVLRGFIRHWPALNEHNWASPAYLRSVAGPGRVVPVEVGSDYRSDDWSQKMMPWDNFLASLETSQQEGGAHGVLYLAQHNLFTQFPALRDDIELPDYVYACPSPTPDFPAYKPPANEVQLVENAWLGPKGTISPAHTDPYFNLFAQVVGCKTVWLAHPSATPHMSPYPVADPSVNPAANITAPNLSNTARVDVFVPADTAHNHPDFWEHVVPHALSITLEPGDLLFVPPGWWHAMRSEDISFSVSLWF